MEDKEILNDLKDRRTPCEVWTRVMGYFRPWSQFNKGKKSEFNDRVWFKEEKENEDGQRDGIE